MFGYVSHYEGPKKDRRNYIVCVVVYSLRLELAVAVKDNLFYGCHIIRTGDRRISFASRWLGSHTVYCIAGQKAENSSRLTLSLLYF